MQKRMVPLLRIDGEQVINIPEELELDTDDVVIYRHGDALVIEPRRESRQTEPDATSERV